MGKLITPWPEKWLRQELETELMFPLTAVQWRYLVESTDLIRKARAGEISYAAKDFPTGTPPMAFGNGQPVNMGELADRVRAVLASDLGVKPPRPVRPPEVVIPRARAQMDALSRVITKRVGLRPEVRRVRQIAVRGRDALAQVEALAVKLSAETGWTEGEARAFLAGRDIRLLPVSEIPRRGRYITLSVDPVVTPNELARAYAEMRRAAVGRTRDPRLSAKHLELAVFMAEQPEGEPPNWEKRMTTWNSRVARKWRYRQVTNFARDCSAAQRRLEGPR